MGPGGQGMAAAADVQVDALVFIGRLSVWRVEVEIISPAARCAVEKWREVFIWHFLWYAKTTLTFRVWSSGDLRK